MLAESLAHYCSC